MRLSLACFASLLAHAAVAHADDAPPPPPPMIIIVPAPPPAPLPADPSLLPPDYTLPAPPPRFVPPPPLETAPVARGPYVAPSGPRMAYRVEGGATFSEIYDISVRGGEATVGVGSEFVGPGAAYMSLTVFGGAQETGLAAVHVQVTGDLEGRFGRFRIGAGASLGYIGLSQAVGDTLALAPTLGVVAFTSVDLVQWGGERDCDKRAVYLQARLRGEVVVGADAAPDLWGPSFGLGMRF